MLASIYAFSSKRLRRIGCVLASVVLPASLSVVLLNPHTTLEGLVMGDLTKSEASYEQRIFDTTNPVSVDIIMDEGSWKDLLDNAMKKSWYTCDVVIDGTRFGNVGIRTKGDSSLSGVAEAGGKRFSLKLKFDKYVPGQTCWGLDELSLNNCYGDATYMKEALVYDMFSFLGADASRYNHAKVMVNGSYWGLYLALEVPDQSFLRRCYADRDVCLYKPGSGGGVGALPEEGGGTLDEGAFEDWGTGGADLSYAGDDLSLYESIWDGQVAKTNADDPRRVVTALKAIGEKRDLEAYLDVDNVLKYMAVHNFSVNLDSLSGDGDHNYFLAESDGRLNLIPWDYNLCLGGYETDAGFGGDEAAGGISPGTMATSTINAPIDDSWALTSFFDGLLEDDRYRARYHEYYQKLIDGYVLGGGFAGFLERTRNNIDGLVRDNPTAFYTHDAYDRAAQMLAQAVELRGQSVAGQLAGTVPSTTKGQRDHPELLVDAGSLDLSVMGTDGLWPNAGESGSGSGQGNQTEDTEDGEAS